MIWLPRTRNECLATVITGVATGIWLVQFFSR
ncbi:hypothetical protein BN439_1428 [Erwinia amylovora Ea644]|nr:hypothetical protein BN439_1428 [Erwinia amylovora Ea644]CDK14654.1 putative membrane protein [Erwinia amylovora LA635]CDK18022.1 hypothetical protein LA636_1030 [Erwinia amylovora LA636]CDK21391.1 putative membrane protein [Erwinia amylovora LA637]